MAACFTWVHGFWACFSPGKVVGGGAEEVHEVGEFLGSDSFDIGCDKIEVGHGDGLCCGYGVC